MNRGIARRHSLRDSQDMRAFLAALGVRGAPRSDRGTCLLSASHALPSSRLQPARTTGRGHEAGAQSLCSALHRLRRRDGSLFRGRYRSRPIRSLLYRLAVVRYIDANAVQARLASTPAHYEYGSARFHAAGDAPPWLATWWIREELSAGSGYGAAFPLAPSSLTRFVDARLEAPAAGQDPIDDLVGSAPDRVLRWMHRKAQLADQTKPGLALCDASSITQLVTRSVSELAVLSVPSGYKRRLRDVVHVALLRDLGGLTYAEMGRRIERSASFCQRTYTAHSIVVGADLEYARLVSGPGPRSLERMPPETVIPSRSRYSRAGLLGNGIANRLSGHRLQIDLRVAHDDGAAPLAAFPVRGSLPRQDEPPCASVRNGVGTPSSWPMTEACPVGALPCLLRNDFRVLFTGPQRPALNRPRGLWETHDEHARNTQRVTRSRPTVRRTRAGTHAGPDRSPGRASRPGRLRRRGRRYTRRTTLRSSRTSQCPRASSTGARGTGA